MTKAIDVAMQVVGGKYKCLILYHLRNQPKRPKELKDLIGGISAKVLTEQLRQLEQDGLVTRTVYAEVPPKVEYALSGTGQSFVPVLQTLCLWAKSYAQAKGETVTPCTVF